MFDKIEIFSKRYDELNNRLYDPSVPQMQQSLMKLWRK